MSAKVVADIELIYKTVYTLPQSETRDRILLMLAILSFSIEKQLKDHT